MSPIQQMLLGVGAKDDPVYIDNVFSTYLYKGNNSTLAINNGLDLTTEGGMIWVKNRDSARDHCIVDTERGIGYRIEPNNSNQGDTYVTSKNISSFTSTGFTLGVDEGHDEFNANNDNYSSWTFRKAKGFFDIVTYTGSSSARTISHNLGCVPGAIFIKKTSGSDYWAVYHEGLDSSSPEDYYLKLNTTDSRIDDANFWNDTKPTASVFSLGDAGAVNSDGHTYVAYLFAGGESITDKAVEFDGTNDYLTIPDNDDWNLGDTFTIEAWVNLDVLNGYNVIISQSGSGGNSWYMSVNSNGSCQFYDFNGGEQIDSASSVVTANTWNHIAIVANSGTAQWYVNGTASGSSGSLNVAGNTSNVNVGAQNGGFKVNGEISNLRVTKGQAIYNSNFAVPDKELTRTSQGAISSNVKLLCCNGSSATSSTVTPDTISATGSPSVTTNNSIFDDPAGFAFGDAGDQGIIKCGSYVGNGSSTAGVEVNLGWEPQLIILKESSNSGHQWSIFDSMRGITTGGSDAILEPSDDSTEWNGANYLAVTPTGFKLESDTNNYSGRTYVYISIRRPDGYVGKPPELGTDVFAMDTSSASSVIPTFDSTFPVDFGLKRKTASTDHWLAGYRLLGQKSLSPDRTNSETDSGASLCWDSNLGFGKTFGTLNQGWMWKRHAGLDVVTYKGNGTAGHEIRHSLNKAAEMIWVKRRDTSGNAGDWMVGHKGLNGGSSPWNEYLVLNKTQEEMSDYNPFNNVAPTTTSFQLSDWDRVNANNSTYIAILFASVDGISKVGSYTGNGTSNSSSQEIVTGFAPRFLIVKKTSGSAYWLVLDTLRGWGSGDDKWLQLNDSAAQGDFNWGYPGPTGFVVRTNDSAINANNEEYIYYAHA